MKLPRFVRKLSTLQRLIACSLIIVFLLSSVYIYLPFRPSFVHASESSNNKELSIPTFINIPTALIMLPVLEASPSTSAWSTQDQTISHLDISGLPGGQSNIVLFGENDEETLGNIINLEKGDEMIITTKNGAVYYYAVSEIMITYPNDPSITSNEYGEKITLFMPYGFLRTKRLVVTAIPQQK